jgi:chemotaxis regulatin CheY-phosphate phosphatase CheZ
MLLAQGYQDLSGQIINAVIKLVTELEMVLGQLVVLANGEDTRQMPVLKLDRASRERTQRRRTAGAGVARGEAWRSQDDIDALIASVRRQLEPWTSFRP